VAPPTLPNGVEREQDYKGDFLNEARVAIDPFTLESTEVHTCPMVEPGTRTRSGLAGPQG
jgi:hypothetical protein